MIDLSSITEAADPLERERRARDAQRKIMTDLKAIRVEAIRELCKTRTQADVAKLLGVTRQAISLLVGDHGDD